jgi:hypothetical protein
MNDGKRSWLVKVRDYPAFVMIVMEGDDDPEAVCLGIFGERLEWVK